MQASFFSGLRRVVPAFVYLLSIHLAALLLTSLFRLILFVDSYNFLSLDARKDAMLQSIAFVRGLWFDNVIGCYVLVFPLLLLSVCALFNYFGKRLYVGVGVFMGACYTFVFVVSAANLPYFIYFFKTINSSILNWMDYGETTLGMMFGERSYQLAILLFVIVATSFALFIWWRWKVFARTMIEKKSMGVYGCKQRLLVGGCAVVCLLLCLFGIRGRMGYNPIRISAAYYCEDAFLNQLGVSPTFNLLRSTIEAAKNENQFISLMDEQLAVKNAQRYLSITDPVSDISPIARHVVAEKEPLQANVVFIFMESLSVKLMGSLGRERTLTPYLDSLLQESLSFDRFYSAGIHTNHGLYSSLYSFPAMMKRNSMKGAVIPLYSGLPNVLKENGYRNLFFMTHESQYDNMNGFLRTNGYDEIYAQENYPTDKVANNFGVPDDYLFEYALPILSERAQSNMPFFATLLTVSNHPPYVIQSYFTPTSDLPEEQIVEYADWSIERFMKEAEKQPWFDNTIFIFMGDHGKLVGEVECEMPEAYNRVPLMFYSKLIEKERRSDFSGQIDVAPTLLGLLHIDYTNISLGIDLRKEQRPCIFFTADDMMGCRNDSCVYIYAPESNQEFFYRYTPTGLTSPQKGDEKAKKFLKDYCFSMLQTAEYLVKNGLTTRSQSVNKKEKIN